MRATLMIAFFGTLISLAATPAFAAPGDVARTMDAPSDHPAGLASDGKHLYLLDWRAAQIHQLAPDSGEIARTWPAPSLKPHGLTLGDGLLYVSDGHTGQIYAFNPRSARVERTFAAPGRRATGLAWADGKLYIAERSSGKVYHVLPEDGTILGYFDLPDPQCTAMAYDGRYLWFANRMADELYVVWPADGTVLGILASPGPYPAGLCWHANHLWNVDFQTGELYEIVVRGEQMYRLFDERRARVEYLWSLYNYGPGDVQDLRVAVALPDALPYQQILTEPEFNLTPVAREADVWGQRAALFERSTVPAGEKAVISYETTAAISAIRYLILPDACGRLSDIPAEIRQQYTADGPRYQVDSAFIQQTVREVVGDEQNPYWIARRIYNHLIEKLEYQMIGGWDVPAVVLKRGTGSCSEYTFAFIALCRAAGLPARYQGSVVVRGDDASIDEAFHRWAQIYLPNYGWVPVDANKGDAKSPVDRARGFGELANRFLITTHGGGGSEYLRWGYNAHATYGMSGYCNVEEENFGFWRPLDAAQPAQTPAVRKPGSPRGECVPGS